jgi:hypothetical protein
MLPVGRSWAASGLILQSQAHSIHDSGPPRTCDNGFPDCCFAGREWQLGIAKVLVRPTWPRS